MAESHVVSGLVSKRSELAGLAQHYRQEIERIDMDVRHLDATIKMFAPEMDLRTLRGKAVRQRNATFKHGEAPRRILDTLRKATAPMTSRDMTESILKAMGLDADTERVESVQKTLLLVLGILQDKKLVCLGAPQGQARTWLIA